MSSSKGEIDQKSLIVIELANRELRQYLMMALMLILNKKETFNNLDKYETKKILLIELFGCDQNKIDKTDMVRFWITIFLNQKHF